MLTCFFFLAFQLDVNSGLLLVKNGVTYFIMKVEFLYLSISEVWNGIK